MRNKLLSSLAGAAFSFAASGLAFAADIATKTPDPSPAPVYNWTGWYVGVNAGASFGDAKNDFDVAPFTVTEARPGPGVRFLSGTIPGFGFSGREYPSGFIGGGQIGYNWQFSPIWVVGLEADFQGALEKDSSTLTNNFSGTISGIAPGASAQASVTGSTVLDYQTKIDWFGTARGRFGYVWGNGNVMSYLTGGLAYGKVDFEGTNKVSGTISPIFPFSVTQAFGHSQVNTGWVVGYGTEGVIDFWGARNWTWKIEGLYMDLGHLDVTSSGASSTNRVGPVVTGVTIGQLTTNSHFTDGILRAGLNYKFN